MAITTDVGSAHRLQRRPRILALLLLLLAVALPAATLLVGRAAYAAPTREISLSAQQGRFDGTNPTLELRVGERVALTVVNRETAALHDLVIAGLKVRTGLLKPGEAERLFFTPSKPGQFVYNCTLHPGQMDGLVVVKP